VKFVALRLPTELEIPRIPITATIHAITTARRWAMVKRAIVGIKVLAFTGGNFACGAVLPRGALKSTPSAKFPDVHICCYAFDMEVRGVSEAPLGLRERKKLQTRETIARVGLELFAERGYENTTLADIAEAANVSKRTIFAYFESKEDILFCDEPAMYEQLRETLEQRPPGATTVDALREFVSSFGESDEQAKLRKRIIGANEGLRLSERARTAPIEELIAESIARDLGAGPDDVRPRLIAASVTAAFSAVRDRLQQGSGEPISHEEALGILDQVLEFLRGGLEALQRD
jgi:AcrR family transcriptional regulator